jgi:Ca2+-binding RTX toxin-like protein
VDLLHVTLLYNNVLDREPDASGLSAWVTRLSEGSSREQIVIGFAQSPEFKTKTEAESNAYANAFFGREQVDYLDDIFRLYQATLNRTPDQKGLEAWTSRLMDGQAYVSIAEGFTKSTEFQNIYGALDSEGFVRQLYRNVLDREPDMAGLTNWTRTIDEGGSREAVVRGFAQSSEFIQKSQDAFETYIRSLEGDVLDGGAGNDILSAGYFADMFVFDAKDRGADIVLQVDTWDILQFNGFGYSSDADILARLTVAGPDVVFEDQGVRVQFSGVNQSTLESVDYIFL